MEEWIEEFLFRGRPPSGPGSEEPPTFQVTIGQQVENPFDQTQPPTRRIVGPLTPTQAIELGWSLTSLVDGINTETLKALEAASTRVTEAEGVVERLMAENASLVARLNTAEPA